MILCTYNIMLQIYLVVCNVLYKLITCHAMKQSEMVWNYFLNICCFWFETKLWKKKSRQKNITSDQNGTHDFKILNSTHFQLVTKQEKQNLTLYFQLYLFLPTLQFATPINIFITLFYNKFTVNHHQIKNYCVVFSHFNSKDGWYYCEIEMKTRPGCFCAKDCLDSEKMYPTAIFCVFSHFQHAHNQPIDQCEKAIFSNFFPWESVFFYFSF